MFGKLRDRAPVVSRWFALACIFGTPWSNAFFRVGLLGFLVFFTISRNIRRDFLQVLKQPIIWLSLGLFTLILLSFQWASQPVEMALYDVSHYRKLLLIPFFATAFRETKEHKLILIAYGLGTLILLSPTVLDGLGVLHALNLNWENYQNEAYTLSRDGAPNLVYWRNQITHGFHVSVLLAMASFAVIYAPPWRWHALILILLCTIDLLFFIYGRMALLSLVLVGICVVWTALKSLRLRLIAIIGVCLLAYGAYAWSPQVHLRMNSISNETVTYYQQGNVQTSAGHRLHYWNTALQMWRDAPLFGQGAGAFRAELVKTNDPLAPEGHRHPHNEYLMQLAEFGAVGLTLLVALLVSTGSSFLKVKDTWLSASLTTALLVFCLNAATDASLHNDWEGWTFVILASIACAQRVRQKT